MKKKLFATILSVILAVTMMPLNAFAGINGTANAGEEEPEYGTHEYWEKIYPGHGHVGELLPGTILAEGTPRQMLFIDDDITVEATEECQSGLIIRGHVTIIIEDGHTLTVKGGDTHCGKGAGAGIEVPEGSLLQVKGNGTLNVSGGVPNDIKRVGGGEAEDSSKTKKYTGKSGKGGNGMGGAGAAIGTKGGNGGLGAQPTNGREDGSIFKDYQGRNGLDGGDGYSSEKSGTFKLSGNIKLIGGNSKFGGRVFGGENGASEYHGIYLVIMSQDRWYGGSGGGGAGGVGFPGALIGTGGSGGAGAGSGGSGGIVTGMQTPSGGGGGAGAGSGISQGGGSDYRCYDYIKAAQYGGLAENTMQGAEGGKGAYYPDEEGGGNGGKGGNAVASADAGKFYSTCSSIEGMKSGRANIDAAGCNSNLSNVYPADECRLDLVYVDGEKVDSKLTHVPTGTVISKDNYKFSYTRENGYIHATAIGVEGGKLADSTMEKAGKIEKTIEDKTGKYTVKCFAQDVFFDFLPMKFYYPVPELTKTFVGYAGEVTDVQDPHFEGYTPKHIPQYKIQADTNIIIRLEFDVNKHKVTFNLGDHNAYGNQSYTRTVVYGTSMAQYLPFDYEKWENIYDKPEEGYAFAGWSPTLDEKVPDKDVTYTAQWVPKTPRKGYASYTVEHYLQNRTADGDYAANTYRHAESYDSVGQGRIGLPTKVNPNPCGIEDYTPQTVEQQIIKEDGSTVVKVYYKLNRHRLVIYNGDHCAHDSGCGVERYVIVGAHVKSFIPEGWEEPEEGYEFKGWSPYLWGGTLMPDQDMTYEASWGEADHFIRHSDEIKISGGDYHKSGEEITINYPQDKKVYKYILYNYEEGTKTDIIPNADNSATFVMPTSNCEVLAKVCNTTFKIKYFKQLTDHEGNPVKDRYEEARDLQEIRDGAIGEMTNADDPHIEGYVVNRPIVQKEIIKGGWTEVEVYLDIK